MDFGMVAAGAIGGLGDSLVQQAAEARETALMQMKRQWDVEDDARRRSQQLDDRNTSRNWQLEDRNTARQWSLDDEQRGLDRRDAKTRKAANVYESLFGTESGNDFSAKNDEGYNGRAQFGQDRLDDWSRATGNDRVDVETFRKNPRLQQEIEQWHFGDIDRYIRERNLDEYEGQEIKGVPITRSGLYAVAHLGGSGGMEKFLKTGGKYDKADSNGTRLSDYARTHGGLSVDPTGVWEVIADPDTPAGLREAALRKMTGETEGAMMGGVDLTGEEWIDNGDGTETFVGKVKGTNQMRAYVGPDGAPIQRQKEGPKAKDLSASMWTRLQKQFTDDMDEVDFDTVSIVGEEMQRLMSEERMSEAEAYRKALASMDYEQVENKTGGGIFPWSAEPTVTMENGEFLGTFGGRGLDEPPTEPAEKPEARKPKPLPKDRGDLQAGDLYIHPSTGETVRFNGKTFEVVR